MTSILFHCLIFLSLFLFSTEISLESNLRFFTNIRDKIGRNNITIYDGRNAKFKSKDNKLYITNI